FTHSFLVLSQIFLLFSGNEAISEQLKGSILTVMIIPSIFSGIAEIIVASLIAVVIVKPLNSIGRIRK
ncbi:MAG: hypothetical protein IJX24_02470, partial [Oscillospiraceae bacterium]|nr:hypothetical protein [Oscillospiraceae bacterium]